MDIIPHATNNRIEYLDGHRGLAILLVVSFHAYSRWANFLPYKSGLETFPIFSYGWLGVELFFLISGFVILMTLEKCSTASHFLFKRWLRLFPGMLLCSLIIFITAGYFFERPAGPPEPISLLPGLTFISDAWWERVLQFDIPLLEGSFWSIYVEFKFYIFAAIFYYWKGRKSLLYALFLVSIFSVFILLLNHITHQPTPSIISLFLRITSFEYFGWFLSGSLFYVFTQSKTNTDLALAILAAVLASIVTSEMNLSIFFGAITIAAIFTISIISSFAQKILQARFLLFFGAISYPLYLLHQNIIISSLVKLHRSLHWIPVISLPLIPILLISLVSYVVMKYGEPKIRYLILKFSQTSIRSIFSRAEN